MTKTAAHPLRPDGPRFAAMIDKLAEVGLPTDDVQDGDAEFFEFVDNGNPIGFGGIVKLSHVGLVRSVVAFEPGRQHGTQIVEALIGEAKAQGLSALWLLTDTAEEFFVRQGFQREARENAPAIIGATRQFQSLCPASAALMVHHLDVT